MPLRLSSDYCNLWVIRNLEAARSTDKAQKFVVIWIFLAFYTCGSSISEFILHCSLFRVTMEHCMPFYLWKQILIRSVAIKINRKKVLYLKKQKHLSSWMFKHTSNISVDGDYDSWSFITQWVFWELRLCPQNVMFCKQVNVESLNGVIFYFLIFLRETDEKYFQEVNSYFLITCNCVWMNDFCCGVVLG